MNDDLAKILYLLRQLAKKRAKNKKTKKTSS